VALNQSGTGTAYAALDIFPDAVGWLLLFFGLRSLSRVIPMSRHLRFSPLYLLCFSLLITAKGTVLFSHFFSPQGVQGWAGESLDLVNHLLKLLFLYLLFEKTAAVCRKNGEDKLAFSHGMTRRIALVEGGLFLLTKLTAFFPVQGNAALPFSVISMLDMIFWIFLIWYGAIALCRAMIRVSD
jgi:hypothetical protein